MLMFPYAFSVPWWVRALVVSYDASAILIPMAAAVLAARDSDLASTVLAKASSSAVSRGSLIWIIL